MRTSVTTLSVLALATVVLAHSQPDLAPRFDHLSHGGGGAQSRMRLRHKRQLEVGAPGTGVGGGGGQSAASASASGGTQQQQSAVAGTASTSAAATVASTQPATTSPRATTTPAAPATPSTSAQAVATSASAEGSSSALDPADETSSSAPTAAQSAAQSSSSSAVTSSSSSSTSEASRVTRTVISSDAQSLTETSLSTASASQSSAPSSAASSGSSSAAASASGSNAALNSGGKDSSSSGGLPKPALIAIIVVGSVLVGALAIWYIIRKTALSPSKRFEKRLRSELDFSPSPTDPDLNDHDSYEPDDAHLVPGTLAHARNISGMSNDRPYGMAGQGVAPGYAASLARSDSGKNSLPGTPPQMSEGLHAMPTMPYGGPQYIQQPYYGAPAGGPVYGQEQAYSFGELHRAGSTGSLRPVSPAMQIPYQSPTAGAGGLDRMPSIAVNMPASADAYGLPYRPDSSARQQHY
ncbi:hypothetical protein JCM3774_005645 [Rhodotorula dairenensis]